MMAQVLELAQLAQRDGMADMDVGRRGVDAQLHVQRRSAGELLLQQVLGNDLGGS